MSVRSPRARVGRQITLVIATLSAVAVSAQGPAPQVQLDRLAGMPGVAEFTKMQEALRSGGPAFVSGAITPTWAPDSQSFTYAFAGKTYRFDVATGAPVETGVAPAAGAGRGGFPAGGRAGGGGVPPAGGGRGGRGGTTGNTPDPCGVQQVERGRQRACEASWNGRMKAYYRDRNLYVSNADGSGEVALSTDGSEQKRIKYGVGSWVYGEELGQTTAIWWSPDSTKVGFYRFDESPVKDYYLQMDQAQIQSSLDVEAYPKAGTDNPIADVLIYDTTTKTTTKVDVRDGKPFTNDVVGHYVYAMTWATDSSELRMNRVGSSRVDLQACKLEYSIVSPK